ncbi:S8 family peptidase [Chryseobacterium suipulveris]|uniref:S8 family peptidase n=1 Tax=Chryseobacterium suipulveris TaxID=2929800 RepID=A0ABY4BRK8_9FLAO|nr:S8 family serine peptidase [Chryseobacterium suipulveris]UOE41399.1 S8 family peptidase [Chryseobacterium suipulveris]
MRKRIYLLTFLFVVFGFLNAQTDFYYYYKGQKKYLTVNKKSFYLFTNNNFDTSSTANLGVEDYILIDDINSVNTKFTHLKLSNEPTDNQTYFQKLNELKQLPNVEHVGLFFENENGELSVGISKYFYVKLKDISDFSILNQTALVKGADIVKQVPNMPKWYIVAVSNGNSISSLELGNQFYETGLFDTVDPAFMFNFTFDMNSDGEMETTINKAIPGGGANNDATCSYDPDFYRLWGLKNNTNSSIDINACQAWLISKGANINVAVVDQGIYFPHLDLTANIGSAGYDAQSGNSGSVYITGNTHGTKVAGIIAAERNNLQVAGVAPKSKIIPISHDLKKDTHEALLYTTISAQLASGITWAWEMENADVINNSWYSAASWLDSQLLEEAIINAIEYGRDGKGCVVVFSAGNNGSNVLYPGSFDERIVTVGAIASNGSKATFSAYGNKLDVVAPGVGIWTTAPTQSITSDDGTSFAAPHVSGIAALILSVNPCLSGQQVRDIIDQTSQKIRTDLYYYTTYPSKPNGIWNEQIGYGLVDAHAAVLMARSLLSTNPCEQGIQETPQQSTLEIIAPNPSSNVINVKYKLDGANSASVVIIKQTGNTSVNNYSLDIFGTETNINVSNYVSGFYTVALIVNGKIVDSKTLIKQ